MFVTVSQWTAALERKLSADAHQLEIIIEVLVQKFGACIMSSLITVVWTNRLVALLLVINNWLVALIRALLRKKPLTRIKIIMLIFDSLLGAVYAMVIAFASFHPYRVGSATESR